jgi:hypothetical protein
MPTSPKPRRATVRTRPTGQKCVDPGAKTAPFQRPLQVPLVPSNWDRLFILLRRKPRRRARFYQCPFPHRPSRKLALFVPFPSSLETAPPRRVFACARSRTARHAKWVCSFDFLIAANRARRAAFFASARSRTARHAKWVCSFDFLIAANRACRAAFFASAPVASPISAARSIMLKLRRCSVRREFGSPAYGAQSCLKFWKLATMAVSCVWP